MPKPVIPTNAFAAGNSCFTNSRVQKLKNSAKQNSWIVCRFPPWYAFSPVEPAFFFPNSAPLNSGLWLGAFGKKRIFMCQSTFAIRFCQRHCVFLCKGTKAQEFCKAEFLDSLPVSALVCVFANETGIFFPEFSSAEFVGFGSRFLVRQGFLGVKAFFLLLSARGWRTSRGIGCVVFIFSL